MMANDTAGVRRESGRFIRFAGAAGFFAKGFLYSFIGVLILVTSTGASEDESPQGVFKKIQSFSTGWGTAILVLLLLGMLLYAVWRLFEAATGLGASDGDGRFKRFFRHRLSPFISACVYLSYAAFSIRLLLGLRSSGGGVCFPSCWRDTAWGTALLALLGLAFLIAFVTQMIPAVTSNFRGDMRADRMLAWPKVAKLFLVLGRVGFLGRAALFAAVSALFWAYVFWPKRATSSGSTISASLDQLTATTVGRVLLGFIGICTICYGVFAAMNTYFKRFVTPRLDR
jgi:hypothetical protein